MKKIVFAILGILLILFGIAQGLQLMGLIGTKTFSLAGIAFTILGFALGAACFKKCLKSE
jgi:hypothetical protein